MNLYATPGMLQTPRYIGERAWTCLLKLSSHDVAVTIIDVAFFAHLEENAAI